MAKSTTRKTGTFAGKSNKLGHGGRAAQLAAKGIPQAVIGEIARSKGAAPGGPNYHGGKKGGEVMTGAFTTCEPMSGALLGDDQTKINNAGALSIAQLQERAALSGWATSRHYGYATMINSPAQTQAQKFAAMSDGRYMAAVSSPIASDEYLAALQNQQAAAAAQQRAFLSSEHSQFATTHLESQITDLETRNVELLNKVITQEATIRHLQGLLADAVKPTAPVAGGFPARALRQHAQPIGVVIGG